MRIHYFTVQPTILAPLCKMKLAVTKESSRSKDTRANIILYLSVFVALLGIPLFLHTTLIHRADLPTEGVELRVQHFEQNAKLHIPIYVETSSIGIPSKDILPLIQEKVDAALARDNLANAWSLALESGNTSIDTTKEYLVVFEQDSEESGSGSQLPPTYTLSPVLKEIRVSLHALASTENIAAFVADLLVESVFENELTAMKNTLSDTYTGDAAFPYSPTYNVVFNLFVEDGRLINWPIEKAAAFIQPVFDTLGNYCRFKISSQIQYYSKLHNEPKLNDEGTARVLSQSDLATFVNYGEWNLNTHDKAPTINFVLFFPKSNYENIPVLVEQSKTNSFLIPQWGGVHIFNKVHESALGLNINEAELENIFEIFASQLFELLGVPKGPRSPFFRVAAFFRLATFKNLKRSLSNLSALIKISNNLNGIAIPESTRKNVEEALEKYDRALETLRQGNFADSVKFAGESVERSDKAFFEKQMVQQAYFPNEHKLAVFLPLLGPICSIVLFGLIKYIKGRKQGPQEKEKKDV